MNRRSFFGKLLALVGISVVAPKLEAAPQFEMLVADIPDDRQWVERLAAQLETLPRERSLRQRPIRAAAVYD